MTSTFQLTVDPAPLKAEAIHARLLDPKPSMPWPFFADDEIAAALEVLRSGKINYWTGQEGRLFEKEFAEFVGCKHAIALANGDEPDVLSPPDTSGKKYPRRLLGSRESHGRRNSRNLGFTARSVIAGAAAIRRLSLQKN